MLVGADVAVKDVAGGVHLSEGGKAHPRFVAQAGAFGEVADFFDVEFAKYH